MLEMQTQIKSDLSLFAAQHRKFIDRENTAFPSSDCLQVSGQLPKTVFSKLSRNTFNSGLHLTLKLPSRSRLLAATKIPEYPI